MPSEFELIDRFFRDLTPRGAAVVEGVGDDCAILRVPAGHELAVTTDTLIAGIHYPEEAIAEDVGWKALACSLSDLAAAGAEPAWALLALTLPQADEEWLAGFATGFAELARETGIALAGGDLTRGPVTTVTVQATGYVPTGQALLRRGARAGDLLCVSGYPGEAAAGLARLRAGASTADPLVRRLHRPEPRVTLGCRLRGLATACIDVSDGLATDIGHLLRASGMGATLDAASLPISQPLAAAGSAEQVHQWLLNGGDDYELCFTIPKYKEKEISNLQNIVHPISYIGVIDEKPGLRIRQPDGSVAPVAGHGYDHFGGGDHD